VSRRCATAGHVTWGRQDFSASRRWKSSGGGTGNSVPELSSWWQPGYSAAARAASFHLPDEVHQPACLLPRSARICWDIGRRPCPPCPRRERIDARHRFRTKQGGKCSMRSGLPLHHGSQLREKIRRQAGCRKNQAQIRGQNRHACTYREPHQTSRNQNQPKNRVFFSSMFTSSLP